MSCKFCDFGSADGIEYHAEGCPRWEDPDSGVVLQYKIGFKVGLLNELPEPSYSKVDKHFYLGYQMGKKNRKK